PERDHEMSIYHNSTGIRQQVVDTVERKSYIGLLNNNQWNYGGIVWDNTNKDNWEYNKSNQNEVGYTTFNGITFGDNGIATIGEGFSGQIAEIIIFEGRISRPATRLMRTYLWVKYGED